MLDRLIAYENEELTEEEIYRAGNSRFESTTVVPLTEGISLIQIKRYCKQTAKELAEEYGATYIGTRFKAQ